MMVNKTGKLATKTNELSSEKLSSLMMPNKEKLKTIPAKGIEIFFLKTTRTPITKKIDDTSISCWIVPVRLHCIVSVYVILFIVGKIVSWENVSK